MHTLREPRAGLYVQQMICTLSEAVDIAHLRTAWQCVVERHQVLRTLFHPGELSEVEQEFVASVRCRIETRDWTDSGPDENERRLAAYLRRDRHRAFALDRTPLWRLCLMRLAERDYRLIWTSHHALLDGRSRRVLLQELFDHYDALCNGVELRLESPQPFDAYLLWLMARDRSPEHEYWRQVLKGFDRATAFPTRNIDQSRPSLRQQDRHRTLRVHLAKQRTSALQQLAEKQQVTFNTLLQGAWALLLSRYARTEDVLFGTTRACRSAPIEGIRSMVGLLINTVPMRISVPAAMVLAEWLQQLRSQWVAMRAHEHASLATIRTYSDVPTGDPLFESLLVFENFQLDSTLQRQGGAWAGRSFRLIGTTNYPLVISGHLGPRLLIELTYDSHRVEDGTATRILKQLANLLEAFVTHPEKTPRELAILSPAEQRQLLME